MEDNEAEFPILCETCLGDNPFLRMTKQECGQACKICDRPFTIFRWRPGARARFKKTQICKTCARLKNVCQTCILDLQFGLPVQVRDKALEETERMKIPQSVTNRDFQFENLEKQLEENGASAALGAGGSANPYARAAASAFLSKLARKRPYYTRNLPHLCSFFERGECKRGAECPYRHEKNEYPEELREQKIKNRFYGVDDPVARKMLRGCRAGAEPAAAPEPPADESVTALFLGGVDARLQAAAVREGLKRFGEISDVNLLPQKGCGFVEFVARAAAEAAMAELKGRLVLGELELKVNWSKSPRGGGGGLGLDYAPPPGMSSLPRSFVDPATKARVRMPPPPGAGLFAAPGRGADVGYPSMNPRNYAASLSAAPVKGGGK